MFPLEDFLIFTEVLWLPNKINSGEVKRSEIENNEKIASWELEMKFARG